MLRAGQVLFAAAILQGNGEIFPTRTQTMADALQVVASRV